MTRRSGLAAAILLLLPALALGQTLAGIRKEFAKIGDKVIPATVTLIDSLGFTIPTGQTRAQALHLLQGFFHNESSSPEL